jgi:nicotinamidase/pyrazinamidase
MALGILLVDPQVDFFPGGALGVADGDQIVAPINALLARHPRAPLFASRDWHPSSTRHFKERGGTWPPHCVQGTRGAAFHEGLDMQRALVLDKGTDPEDDAGYSAFEAHKDGVSLAAALTNRGVDVLLIAGLATDYCVKASVLGALDRGIETLVLLSGIRAVNLEPGDGERAIAEMRARGALFVT